MSDSLTNEQWRKFQTQGYLRLGKVATEAELEALQQRMDDIMLGRAPLDYDRMAMQLDREPGTGKPGPQSKGHKGATLSYRKIQDLEYDPHFLAYMQKPLFRHICARVYGEETTVACYRAMFMNKTGPRGDSPDLAPGPLVLSGPRSSDHNLDCPRSGQLGKRLCSDRARRPPLSDQPIQQFGLSDPGAGRRVDARCRNCQPGVGSRGVRPAA